MLFATGRQIAPALAILEEAISCDPDYGPALALASICCFRLCADGASEDPGEDRRKGLEFGHKALRVARDNPSALSNAAFALGWFGEDIGLMLAVVDRALKLNPGHARGWYISGTLRLFAGDTEVAIQHLDTAVRLCPRARLGTVNLHIGMAHFFEHRFDEALAKLLLEIQDVEPDNPGPYRYLAACYAHTGRLDDARRVMERLLAVTPLVFEDLTYLRNPEHRKFIESGLHLALNQLPRGAHAYSGAPACS
jgi:adenylate cyclase